jgi:hypothetical protein
MVAPTTPKDARVRKRLREFFNGSPNFYPAILSYLAGKGSTISELRVPDVDRTGGDRERCIAAGMNDDLTEPIDSDQAARLAMRWIFLCRIGI